MRPIASGSRQDSGTTTSAKNSCDVIEARSLTFERLFVIGLNRGVFPRIVNEDPLLPDSLRAVLSRQGFGLLQDLPQKLSGFDEKGRLAVEGEADDADANDVARLEHYIVRSSRVGV